MRSKIAVLVVGFVVFLPTNAVASGQYGRSAPPPASPPSQSAMDTQGATDNSASATAQTKTTCQTKPVTPRATSPSAQVGKDTGWVPPRRKPKVDPACSTQPQ